MADSDQSPRSPRSLPAALERAWRTLLWLARESARRAGPALAASWRAARPILRTALQVLLALIIVFEEWGWQPLADLMGRLARWRPLALLETGIARLPPYAALLVFFLPTLLLLPLKLLAVVLVARGQVVLAGLLFVAAKVGATALVARLFLLTQPALMQIGWFAWGYDIVVPWKNALVDRVHNSYVWRVARLWKERARRALLRQWWQIRPRVRIWRAYGLIIARGLRTQARQLARSLRRRMDAFLTH